MEARFSVNIIMMIKPEIQFWFTRVLFREIVKRKRYRKIINKVTTIQNLKMQMSNCSTPKGMFYFFVARHRNEQGFNYVRHIIAEKWNRIEKYTFSVSLYTFRV